MGLHRREMSQVGGLIAAGHSDNFIVERAKVTLDDLNELKKRLLRPVITQLDRTRRAIIAKFKELGEVSPTTVRLVGRHFGIKSVRLAVWLGLPEVWQMLSSLRVTRPKNDFGRRTGWGVTMIPELLPAPVTPSVEIAFTGGRRSSRGRPQRYYHLPPRRYA